MAAFTDLSSPQHTPEMAYQWDTLMLKEHRGRRLGQLVKAANLRAMLTELPGVRRVVTWNADVNAPLLRVNRAMVLSHRWRDDAVAESATCVGESG